MATVASLDVAFPHGDWPAVELPGGVSFAVSPSVGVNERGRPGPDPRQEGENTRQAKKTERRGATSWKKTADRSTVRVTRRRGVQSVFAHQRHITSYDTVRLRLSSSRG